MVYLDSFGLAQRDRANWNLKIERLKEIARHKDRLFSTDPMKSKGEDYYSLIDSID